MRRTSTKELAAVLALDGPARYEHFVKRVVDAQMAWGLWHDGWALMGDNHGNEVFPLWPAKEYAEAMRIEEWASYEPASINLSDLLDEVLPELAAAKRLPGVFPTPHGKGVIPTIAELEAALRAEMTNYE